MIPRWFARIVVCSTVLFLVFFSGLTPFAPAAEANFKGKILHIHVGTHLSLFLEDAQIRKVADRVWLVGKGADVGGGANWQKGRTVWVPWERIEEITEFNNVQDAKKALEEEAKSLLPAAPDKEK